MSDTDILAWKIGVEGEAGEQELKMMEDFQKNSYGNGGSSGDGQVKTEPLDDDAQAFFNLYYIFIYLLFSKIV